MKKGEVITLIVFVLLTLVGWGLFGVFYSAWVSTPITQSQKTEKLWATIGLVTGSIATAGLFISAFVIGTLEHRRKAVQMLKTK